MILAFLLSDAVDDGVGRVIEVGHLLDATTLKAEVLLPEGIDASARRVDGWGHREAAGREPAFLLGDSALGLLGDHTGGDRREHLRNESSHVARRRRGRSRGGVLDANELGGEVACGLGFPVTTQGVVAVGLGQVFDLAVQGELEHGCSPWSRVVRDELALGWKIPVGQEDRHRPVRSARSSARAEGGSR